MAIVVLLGVLLFIHKVDVTIEASEAYGMYA